MSQFIPEFAIPESLESACPQFYAIEYRPEPRGPQTILAINDEKIRNHLIKSNQEETSSRHRQFLQEVIEGRRQYLREAAWLEPSNLVDIPLARPMFLPQVTVAFSPGDLDFEIMAQKARKSKTLQDPTVTFEAESIESKVRSIGPYVGDVLRSYGNKNEQGCRIRSIAKGEFSCYPPECLVLDECCNTSEPSRIDA
uniref:Uncharacterized protein n=1 Tax=Cannabis sativa TaxID=3483 RepID=A0A803NI15_CANSA